MDLALYSALVLTRLTDKSTPEAYGRVSLGKAYMKQQFLFLIALSLIGSSWANAAPATPTLNICVKEANGTIKAKRKCGRGEKPFSASLLDSRIQSAIPGTGLSVYDSRGVKLGAFVRWNEVLIDLNGMKYWSGFTPSALLSNDHFVFFSMPACQGKPYARDFSPHANLDIGSYSQLGSLIIGHPNATLYLTTGQRIEAFSYNSLSRDGVCENTIQTSTRSGYELLPMGPASSIFVPPFDVRE